MSEGLGNLVLRECRAANFSDCDLVFSGLNSDIAGETGMIPYITTTFIYAHANH